MHVCMLSSKSQDNRYTVGRKNNVRDNDSSARVWNSMKEGGPKCRQRSSWRMSPQKEEQPQRATSKKPYSYRPIKKEIKRDLI